MRATHEPIPSNSIFVARSSPTSGFAAPLRTPSTCRSSLTIFSAISPSSAPGLFRQPRRIRPGAELGEIAEKIVNEERHVDRSEEHTSELQSHLNLVCRLLLEKKK